MTWSQRLMAAVFAIVLLLACVVGALLALSAGEDLFRSQVGLLRGVGELVAGVLMGVLAGALGIAYVRRVFRPNAPSAAA